METNNAGLTRLFRRLCQAHPSAQGIDCSKLRRLLTSLGLISDKLTSELVNYIFNRCLQIGERRLQYLEFQRALVLFSAIVYPKLEPRLAWTDFQRYNLSSLMPETRRIDLTDLAVLAGNSKGEAEICADKNQSDAEEDVLVSRPPSEISVEEIKDRKLDIAELEIPIPAAITVAAWAKFREGELQALLDSSEANNEVKSANMRPDSANVYIDSPGRQRGSPRIRPADFQLTEIWRQAESLEIVLKEKFNGDMLKGFRYFDSITKNRSGKISLLKFVHGCKAVGFTGDLRPLFHFFDSDCDGAIDVREFIEWRNIRASRRLMHT